MLKLPAILLALLVLGPAAPTNAASNSAATRKSSCAVVSPTTNKIFGVMDDAAPPNLVADSCFNVLKKTVWLTPTNWHLKDLSPTYLGQLDQQMDQAAGLNLKVIFQLWLRVKGTAAVPLSPSQQRGVCDVGTDLALKYPAQTFGIEIGVEPNNPTFWQPQFASDGSNASAAAYESWLATCYQRIKAVAPSVLVIGGSLASHGNDDPSQGINRASTSPVVFIQKMCAAYRASNSGQPIMDWFDMHSYQDDMSQPPSTTHPSPSTTITIGDYDKLESQLQCFAGSAQNVPPVLWGESGYELQGQSGQPSPSGNQAPGSVSNPDQLGAYYASEIQMAYCQPNSVGFIEFLLIDQQQSSGWQSGMYYYGVPLVAKSALKFVVPALQSAEAGVMQC